MIERYETLLIDAYGVLVDSTRALPGAADFNALLDRTDKPYFIVTNDASKLPATSAQRYAACGLDIGADRVITSGSLLRAYYREHALVGSTAIVLGPEDSRRYVEQAGGCVVPHNSGEAHEADVVIIADEAGYPFLESVDTVLSVLLRRLDRGDPPQLILPNPDLIYPAGDGRWGLAAGSIAASLEAAMTLRHPDAPRFVRLGKPHRAIFEAAEQRAGTRNLLMIGDQLATDIKGANDFGIDSVLVGSGVALATSVDNVRPTYVVASVAVT